MIVLGLTGSIGMGKTTVVRALKRSGISVHEADRLVHDLLSHERDMIEAVAARFPGTLRKGEIDRKILRKRVFGNPEALRSLESIIHPYVVADQRRFLRRERANRSRVVALDIPLLFETGDADWDFVLVVSAPPYVQSARVLQRSGMTASQYAAIMARQLPDAEKCRRADIVIPAGLDRGMSCRLVKRIAVWASSGRLRPRRGRGRRHDARSCL
jgi:dephospho-CoA kinase